MSKYRPVVPSPHRLIAILLALALLLLPGSALAQSTGVVDGQLVNGSAGAGPPTGARVSLYRVRDKEILGENSQPVDAQGAFHFEGLDTDPSLVYLLVTEYQSVVYPHPQLVRLNEQARQTLRPQVYETTSDSRAISFERANLLVLGVDASGLTVMEMGAVANSGDRTYVGDEQGVLRLSLPVGATAVEAETGISEDDIQIVPGGVVSRRPIAPGRHQVAVRFEVPVTGSVVDLSMRLDYPVTAFTLYLPEGSLQASSPQLQRQGGAPVEMGGSRFQVYAGQELAAGSQLAIRVSGLPGATRQLTAEQLAAATLGAALLLGSSGWLLLRRRRGRMAVETAAVAAAADSGPRPAAANPLEIERRRLVVELAELDERFATGALPEDDYRLRRNEGKQRLLAVARQLEEVGA